MKRRGIDVSVWQKDIDWDKVKVSGIEFAILRCGFGNNISSQDDKKWVRNLSECVRVGMPKGVYLYSYAMNLSQAQSEAEHLLRLIQGNKFEYPIVLDVEEPTQLKLPKETLIQIVERICSFVEIAGYYVSIYASLSVLNNQLNDSRLDRFDKWVAQWSSNCTYKKNYGIWQYSSDGSVAGINGRVDMNIAYKDYPAIIKTLGLNGFIKDNTTISTTPPTLEFDLLAFVRRTIRGDFKNAPHRYQNLLNTGLNEEQAKEVQRQVNLNIENKTTRWDNVRLY